MEESIGKKGYIWRKTTTIRSKISIIENLSAFSTENQRKMTKIALEGRMLGARGIWSRKTWSRHKVRLILWRSVILFIEHQMP